MMPWRRSAVGLVAVLAFGGPVACAPAERPPSVAPIQLGGDPGATIAPPAGPRSEAEPVAPPPPVPAGEGTPRPTRAPRTTAPVPPPPPDDDADDAVTDDGRDDDRNGEPPDDDAADDDG